MVLGAYGIKRPADVKVEDVQIIVHQQANRDASSATAVFEINASTVLTPVIHNGLPSGGPAGEILGGLYDLKLPSAVFSNKGIYTVYIRPLEIRTTILDCGILSSLPNVKGLVFDLNSIPAQFRNRFSPMDLVGYRIEYLDADSGAKINNFYRIVTSNFYCTTVEQNNTNPNQTSPRYVYTNAKTNLVYCTLTPTSAPSNNPNAIPFIGQPGQSVIITNTYFNPTVLDIEMVDHDFETLAIALYGNQAKSIDNGIYTLYDLSGTNNIYMQYDLYEVRDQFNGQLYEVKQNRGNNIDFSQMFGTITNF